MGAGAYRKRWVIVCIFSLLVFGCRRSQIIVAPTYQQVWNEYISQAEMYYQDGNYADALENYLNAERMHGFDDAEISENISILYYKIGRCYEKLTDYVSSEDNFKKSLSIAERSKSEEVMLDNYYHLIRLYKVLGDDDTFMEEASQYIEPAERLAIKLYGNASTDLGYIYGCTGDLYQRQGNSEKAVEYIEKALNIMKEAIGEHSAEYAEMCFKMAMCYEEQGEYDMQIDYIHKSVEILEKQNDPFKLREVYGELGGAYTRRKQEHETARAYLDKSIELSNKNGYIDVYLAKYHYWKASACYYLVDYDNFLSEIAKGYRICTGLPIESELVRTLKELIMDNLEIYYEYNYEGDKTSGFEAWADSVINE